MDTGTMYDLLCGSMDNLYAFALSRLGNAVLAEDLTSEIILQIIKSHKSIKNDDSFFGFMWAVAQNTYKKYLRRKKYEVSYDCNFIGINYETPENIAEDNEQIILLRRELSMLSEKYRDITVKYYINGMSYKDIASELDISAENVRYTLFKVRKILKEGIEMEKRYGEQSYNPKIFAPDSWGNVCYLTDLFKRRLPGNILFAAYKNPAAIADISLELGVSSVYLEDELDILVNSGLIKKNNDKYLTDIVILSDEFELTRNEYVKNALAESVSGVRKTAKSALGEVSSLNISYCDKSENRLMWLIYFEALKLALWDCHSRNWKTIGGVPQWPDGSETLFYGHDNNYRHSRFNGIYGCWKNKSKTAYATVFNYKAFENQQNFQPKWEDIETFNIMCDIAAGIPVDTGNLELIRLIDEKIIISENGVLSPAFPVFTSAELKKFDEIIQPLTKKLICEIDAASDKGAALIDDYVPRHLKRQARTIAKFDSSLAAVGLFMDILVECGILILPCSKINLGIIGVIL